jgi:hypothetical protein
LKSGLAVCVIALLFASCAEQPLPLMTTAQQQSYNTCMSGRWSGAADTFWWEPAGWAYHDDVQNNCLAKSGSLGTTVPTVSVVQPQPASTESKQADVARSMSAIQSSGVSPTASQ